MKIRDEVNEERFLKWRFASHRTKVSERIWRNLTRAMKIKELGSGWWNKIRYVTMVDEGPNDKMTGWSFLPKERIQRFINQMNVTRTCKVIAPRNGKVKIVFRKRDEKVFVIEEPRLPLFSMLMHHHGIQRSTVDEEYKCTRCGLEVPDAVKSLVMMESTFGLDGSK